MKQSTTLSSRYHCNDAYIL